MAVLLGLGATAPIKAETYTFDPLHTQILFFVDHFGFSKSQGEFLDFSGEFSFNKNDFEDSQVVLSIAADSVDMDDEEWNRKMRGDDYFDTRNHPTIEFRSTSVEALDDRNALVRGDLTMLGKTRPISVNMTFNKSGTNLATGRRVAGFSGGANLKRSDFGMDKHLKFIGNEIEIRLEVEGVAARKKTKNDL